MYFIFYNIHPPADSTYFHIYIYTYLYVVCQLTQLYSQSSASWRILQLPWNRQRGLSCPYRRSPLQLLLLLILYCCCTLFQHRSHTPCNRYIYIYIEVSRSLQSGVLIKKNNFFWSITQLKCNNRFQFHSQFPTIKKKKHASHRLASQLSTAMLPITSGQ